MNRIDKLYLELHGIRVTDSNYVIFEETGYQLNIDRNEITARRQYDIRFGKSNVDDLINRIMEDNKKFKMYRKMYLNLIEAPLIEKKLYISAHLEEL